MITKMFSLWDSKAECYGTPFFMPNRAMAERALQDLAQDRSTMVARHPSDYILYELGTFDDNTGIVEKQNPISLGSPKMEPIDLGKIGWKPNSKPAEEVVS